MTANPPDVLPRPGADSQEPRAQRVAFYHPCLVHGGIPHVFLQLAGGLAEQGIAVDLVQATPPPAGQGAEFAGQVQFPPGVRRVDLNARRVLSSVAPLVRYLRRERPGALISGALHANVAAAWARRMARVPVKLILTEHSIISAVAESAAMLTTSARTRWAPFFVRRFYPWADAWVAVSSGAADDLATVAGIPRSQIQVIYNPVISAELFARAEESAGVRSHAWFAPGQPPVILAVGRLDHYKDYPTLLRAFAELRRTRSARLLIFGEGEERPALQALAHSLEIEKDVAMPGNIGNPLPFIKQAAVFALSSKTESFGLVLVEALAMGATVVATDCRYGPREILLDGALGRLVPVGDVQAMATALGEALSAPKAPPPLSSLQRFSREQSIRAYCRLLGIA
jgi:glycosyltransferase involved in cell wall biosynthesis